MNEHIIITELPGGLLKLVPEAGWRLYHIYLDRYYSEAVIEPKDLGNFKAVAA